ncbi:MAG: C1 family peptidase [Chlamydiota bacterium]
MKKLLLFLLLAAVVPLNLALSADGEYTIMRPDNETRVQWMKEDLSLPKQYIDPAIKPKRGSFSLLQYLPYVPAERNQGNCGDCWAWAGTGCAEVAHSVAGVSDRLSIQYINSCGSNGTGFWCCCGGTLFRFSDWYAGQKKFVPWANTNAGYADASLPSYTCPVAPSSAVSCGSISTSPHYPINSIGAQTIATYGATQATAIANIKNALQQNKAVYFAFWLPNETSWAAFRAFWNNNDESSVFDVAAYSGLPWVDGEGGGHAVLIVGYDDTATPPYWVVVNSWGLGTSGLRTNGIFHQKMDTNYDASMITTPPPVDPAENAMMLFQTLDVSMGPVPPIDLTPNKTTFKTTGQIGVNADVAVISTPCYPFVRITQPNGQTIYFVDGGKIYPTVTPFLGVRAGPVTVQTPMTNLPLLALPFKDLPTGTYILQGGAVDATKTTSVDDLKYVGSVDTEMLLIEQ